MPDSRGDGCDGVRVLLEVGAVLVHPAATCSSGPARRQQRLGAAVSGALCPGEVGGAGAADSRCLVGGHAAPDHDSLLAGEPCRRAGG